MVEKYNKPHLTFGDQAAQLQLRGLIINNPDDCIGALEKIGYYRLSAYWYPFRKKNQKRRELLRSTIGWMNLSLSTLLKKR
ncbi:hypothetical protein CIP107546_01744 [Corynebacterium diphtheriae]|nr:hypothetical protein CIP107550_01698 [Corynebacterium diphtheriae]CAB0614406.1 hypothetical protein CIP107546_01744 [Corynebacterium diphtheriae]CAB0616261.1 hypothetical protein CIP107544_01875 [Corynebacterium diphtheriae]CAB0659185.1 hypothetical protein CIP107572_01763 [Corynebacterium diphtheriae]CAB0660711.1 hypothetical protein CIP107571_01809 [Corynebacterium diphtheriae]